ncbi:MAG: glycosyltransferase family 4 protein [Candidatus Roizmanbacteria bacterium]|nr:glycosyltransferase family 4 protein [Candidatus Roizmanbacteria bacterium]
MKKNIKVALLAPITHSIPPIGYGPWELVVYNLAESLVKLGIDVTLFASKQTTTSAKLDYIVETPLNEIDQKFHSSFSQKHIAYVISKSTQFDLIHNHFNIHPVLFAKTIKTPMVTTLHGSACEKVNALYYLQCQKENFISISFAERKYMPNLNYIGNVYNGIDFAKYKVKNRKGDYFVFSGRIVKDKGILSAIKFAQQTNIPLKIAGIITDQQFFDTLVKPHVDNKLITFLGNLPIAQLVILLQNAIATLCFVEWDEPFGLSALDSLACGVPVIATNRGAFSELIYNKQMGIIVNSVDEAIKRLNYVQKIDSTQCSAFARLKFSQEIIAQNYLQCYLKLLKK